MVMADGEMTSKQRNKLLAEMTDEVGLLVLQRQLLPDPGALRGRPAARLRCWTPRRG